MPQGHATNPAGYATIAEQLARQALSVAADAAPHRAREGEKRWPMANALPAARVLLGEADSNPAEALPHAARELVETLADPSGKVTDGIGHHRPSYVYLALHLLGTAARILGDNPTADHLRLANRHWAKQHASVDDDTRLVIWRRLMASHASPPRQTTAPTRGDAPAPLVPLGLNDLIDAWTYRELVGLHGLHLTAVMQGDEHAAARATSAALFHLGHTQPDYTTYQPWALAAFASDPRTAGFAEQQLHDVASHLSLSGPGGAVLPALLLVDASATMAGRAARAWSQR